jgi:hypothetical protein
MTPGLCCPSAKHCLLALLVMRMYRIWYKGAPKRTARLTAMRRGLPTVVGVPGSRGRFLGSIRGHENKMRCECGQLPRKGDEDVLPTVIMQPQSATLLTIGGRHMH